MRRDACVLVMGGPQCRRCRTTEGRPPVIGLCPRPTRVRRDGPTGSSPRATARCRILAPASARALSSAGLSGGVPGRARADVCIRPGLRPVVRRARASASRREQVAHPRHPDTSWRSRRLGTARGMEGRWFERPQSGGRGLDEGGGLSTWPPTGGARSVLGAEACRPGRGRRVATQRFSRGERGCQGPNRAGHPRPLLPCSATDKMAARPWRVERPTWPRGTGRGSAIRA